MSSCFLLTEVFVLVGNNDRVGLTPTGLLHIAVQVVFYESSLCFVPEAFKLEI